ncbi:MAG: hypothetical protein AAFW75_23520 [Cyanobacteria bacterium J06636_16]
MITAQADRLYQALASQNSEPNPGNAQDSTDAQANQCSLNPLPQIPFARAIAVLYQDHFQFIANPQALDGIDPETINLSQLSELFQERAITIGTPCAEGKY